jgi:hypothetical protein
LDFSEDLFVDSACMQPAASVPGILGGAECYAFEFISTVTNASCGQQTRIFQVGTAPTETWTDAGGTCEGPTPISDPSVKSYGAEAAPATFVEAQVHLEDSTRRLRELYLEAPGGATQPIEYWDSARNARCTLADLGGTHVCLPPLASVTPYFADSACSPASEIRAGVDYGCSPAGLAQEVLSFGDGCTTFSEIKLYALGAPLDPNTLYTSNGVDCVPVGSSPGFTAYALGAEVLLGDFASLELLME